MKFAQQTITQKFNSSRNSDTFINKVQNAQPKKASPSQIKLSNKLKNNLMLDGNATFMAVERSRSGIGAPMATQGMTSPLGGATNFATI